MKMFKKIVKWTGISLLTILGLALIAYVFVYVHTEGRINKQYQYAEETIAIPTDSLSILKGEHLYQIRGCQDCHGKNLQGGVFMNDALLMRITAPNLTKGKGGLPDDFNINDWVRVIRHGVDNNGRSLFMMPSQELYQLTNEDLANIIAYCTTQKPINTSQERMRSIGPVGRLLMTMNQVTILPAEKIDHQAEHVDKKEEKISAAYGKYLATGCQGCHRATMRGGSPLAPGFPPVPDITSNGHLRNWSASSFIRTIKTGTTPEGKALNNQYMPWQSISLFTDDELKSIFLYLKTLPAKP